MMQTLDGAMLRKPKFILYAADDVQQIRADDEEEMAGNDLESTRKN